MEHTKIVTKEAVYAGQVHIPHDKGTVLHVPAAHAAELIADGHADPHPSTVAPKAAAPAAAPAPPTPPPPPPHPPPPTAAAPAAP
jgi:hypothetical protein